MDFNNGIVAAPSAGLSAEKEQHYQVQITHDMSGLHVAPCLLLGTLGDTWRFTNSASDTIYLFILGSAICIMLRRRKATASA